MAGWLITPEFPWNPPHLTMGQTFTATGSTLTELDFRMTRLGPDPIEYLLVVEIVEVAQDGYTLTWGDPVWTSEVLIMPGTATADQDPVFYDLDLNLAVTEGALYAYVIRALDGPMINVVFENAGWGTNPYPDGGAFFVRADGLGEMVEATDLFGPADAPFRVVFSGGASGRTIDGGAKRDVIGAGDGARNTSAYDDIVMAGGGNDVVHGGQGDDQLYGGRGNDRLYGEAGDDFISGGVGNDRMSGGGGDDTFVFGAGARERDFISDFGEGDYIELSGVTLSKVRQIDTDSDGAADSTVLALSSGATVVLSGFTDWDAGFLI